YQCVFDITYLNCIPNLILFAPINEIELRNGMYTAQLGLDHPIAIRYPRGRGYIQNWQLPFEKIEIGKARRLSKGRKIAILSTGTIGNNVLQALEQTENRDLFSHYHFPFIKPLDIDTLKEICNSHEQLITIEDGSVLGGFGSTIATFMSIHYTGLSVKILGIPDEFIEHGTVIEQQRKCKIDINSLITIFSSY
ncbi:MAG: 1-deoxy-D-xylulose-5-phosphate synthase, partial [Flavobacterium sp.]|nr:1-deoxy-D-xylulose-5-phosphate synthase [Flavobacterium sp.]